MEMLNRAIEEAREFEEFKRRVTKPGRRVIVAGRQTGKASGYLAERLGMPPPRTLPPRRPGENREQYRARVFAK